MNLMANLYIGVQFLLHLYHWHHCPHQHICHHHCHHQRLVHHHHAHHLEVALVSNCAFSFTIFPVSMLLRFSDRIILILISSSFQVQLQLISQLNSTYVNRQIQKTYMQQGNCTNLPGNPKSANPWQPNPATEAIFRCASISCFQVVSQSLRESSESPDSSESPHSLQSPQSIQFLSDPGVPGPIFVSGCPSVRLSVHPVET